MSNVIDTNPTLVAEVGTILLLVFAAAIAVIASVSALALFVLSIASFAA